MSTKVVFLQAWHDKKSPSQVAQVLLDEWVKENPAKKIVDVKVQLFGQMGISILMTIMYED